MEKRVLDLIKDHYSDFTKSYKKIGGYILENYFKVTYLPIFDLAKEIGLSDATLIRFSREIGFANFSDMRDAIRKEISIYASPSEMLLRSKEFDQKKDSLFQQVSDNDFATYEDFHENVNYALIDNIADEITNAETIHLIGFGTDKVVALFLDWYLRMMGFTTYSYTENGFGFANRLSRLKENDLIIISASPRHLKDEKHALEIAQSKGVRIVSLTTPQMTEITLLSHISLRIESHPNVFLNSYVSLMGACNLILIRVYEKNRDTVLDKVKQASSFMDHFEPYA